MKNNVLATAALLVLGLAVSTASAADTPRSGPNGAPPSQPRGFDDRFDDRFDGRFDDRGPGRFGFGAVTFYDADPLRGGRVVGRAEANAPAPVAPNRAVPQGRPAPNARPAVPANARFAVVETPRGRLIVDLSRGGFPGGFGGPDGRGGAEGPHRGGVRR